jgi:HAE1 family hydrophobic/amphiphilic exporter-1
MSITEIAIKRPSLVVVFFAVLGILGIMGYTQLKYELLPKISPPVVVITTAYPGASPSEVETNITKVIEDAVSGMDKVSAVRATSFEGSSFVTIEFTQSANIEVALQDAQRKVNAAQARLPKDARAPILSKIALDEIPVVRMGATSNLPSREFYQMLKDQIQPRLSKLDGIGQITLLGGEERQIRINLDAQKLRAYGLSVLQVTQAIKASNLDFPTGKIKETEGQFIVRVAGKFSSLDELKGLVVGRSRAANGALGGDIRLADVAEIQDGIKETTTISRINGVTSIGVLVNKASDANSVDVSKRVRKEIVEIEKDFAAQNVKFTIAQDGSLFTIDAADAVKHDLVIAIILVAAVMLLFLHSLRSSFIVMVAIPASLISTCAGMWAFGFSLNLMTLLAMSLVVGILVDDSIVVLENIYRHLEMGKDKRVAALEGRNEIGFAALSITLVDVVVFLPLSLLPGIVGNILREFCVVVVIATLMSLVVSFTITPAMAARVSRLEHLTRDTLLGRFALWFESLFDAVTRQYQALLKWSLAHKITVVAVTVVLLVASIALIPLGFIGAEFITQADRGEFAVTIELPSGATVEQTNQTTLQVERIMSKIPEIQKLFVNVGVSSEGLLGFGSNNAAEINVSLVPLSERTRSTDDISIEIKKAVASIPGVKVRVNPIGIFGTANQTPIQMVVSGANYNNVLQSAKTIAEVMKTVPGTADVRLNAEDGKPETRIEIDRQKMANFGLTINDVGATLRVALAGDDDSKFRDGNTEYTMLIALDEFDRSKTDNLASMTFTNPRGQQIELQQFARIYQSSGPTKLQRENRNAAITIFSQAVGRPSGTVVADIKTALEGKIPAGVSVLYGGDQKNQDESFGNMGLAVIVALLFVYLVMVALYDSYLYPFIVLFSVPVAIVGALLAMALAAKAIGIFPMLGIIMLIGLVTKNAILLVDRTNQTRIEQNLSTYNALLEAGESRLRPIVMTTVAMVIGMLPIAVAGGSGSEWKSGLAWALIGGLTSSMFLTLVLVPVVYIKLDEWKHRLPAFVRRLTKRSSAKPTKEHHDVPSIEGIAQGVPQAVPQMRVSEVSTSTSGGGSLALRVEGMNPEVRTSNEQ